jgi:hypothetical protein
MPEGSVDIKIDSELTQTEDPTPLDPINDLDINAQRKIIGFMQTHEPRVLGMSFYPVTLDQKREFSSGII